MKQHFSVTVMADVQLISNNAVRHQVDEAAWATIKSTIGVITLPEGWTRMYSARSLTVRSRTGAFTLKVTLDKQLFVDRRLKNKSYKSDTVKCASMEEACEVAAITIAEVAPPVTALQ